jgi:hypothetical protein
MRMFIIRSNTLHTRDAMDIGLTLMSLFGDIEHYGVWRLAHPSGSQEELYVTRKLLQILLLTVSSICTLV